MDLSDRLDGVGLSKAEFADRLGVGKSTVSNWIARGSIPEEAEGLLSELEAGVVTRPSVVDREDGQIEVGAAVLADGRMSRIVRRDRCECLFGSKPVDWVYHVATAYETKEGWEIQGPSMTFTRRHLETVDRAIVWAERKARAA